MNWLLQSTKDVFFSFALPLSSAFDRAADRKRVFSLACDWLITSLRPLAFPDESWMRRFRVSSVSFPAEAARRFAGDFATKGEAQSLLHAPMLDLHLM